MRRATMAPELSLRDLTLRGRAPSASSTRFTLRLTAHSYASTSISAPRTCHDVLRHMSEASQSPRFGAQTLKFGGPEARVLWTHPHALHLLASRWGPAEQS